MSGYRQTLWLTALILAAAVLVSNLDFEIATDQAGENLASLTLSYGSGKARRFEGPVIENMTILDALNSASIGGSFDVGYSFESNGDVNLSAVDGQIANDIKKWRLRLNDLEIDAKDIGRIRIKKYDSIEARFE